MDLKDCKWKLAKLGTFYPDMDEDEILHLALDALFLKTLETMHGPVAGCETADERVRNLLFGEPEMSIEDIVEKTLADFEASTK
jgi:hypothetical protein